MNHRTLISLSTIALFASSGLALADVTAEQVWQNWKDLGTASGQTYAAASEARAGDTLTLTDLTIASSSDGASATGIIPMVAFTENGDGTVSVTMSEEYSFQMQMKDATGNASSNRLIIGQQGMALKASGTPEALNYDYTADSVTINALDFMVDGKPREMDIDIALNDPVISYAVTPGDLLNLTSTLAAQSLAFRAVGMQKDDAGRYEVTGQMNQLAGASTGALMKAAVTAGLAEMLAGGFATETAFTYGDGNIAVSNTAKDGGQSQFDAASATGGNFNLSMDRTRVAYGFGGRGVTLRAAGAGLPMGLPEISAAYDEASAELLMPLATADTPQPFSLNTRLKGLTVAEGLWSIIDPGATLPRDPATLVIETSGTMLPLKDMTSPDAMTGATPPAQIHSLDVNALQLTLGGAAFTGKGALTFDNSQPPVLGGVVPMPQGKLNLTLDGANGLIAKLQALGLVDPQMAQTFGMMSMMLARPGAGGPDSLVSEIEFTPAGILANGMPLPF